MTSESSLSCSSSDLSSESDCSIASSEYVSAIEEDSTSEFAPYDDNIEPIATEEERQRYEEEVAREKQEEEELLNQFSGDIALNSWCSCSNCRVDILVNSQECRCCMEIQQCQDKLKDLPSQHHGQCITTHQGFQDVCLNEWVLEVASLSLRTKTRCSYAKVFAQNDKTRSEYLRAVAYRQLVRLVWDFTGSSRRLPLPSCCYHAIRSKFPNPKDKAFKGFEEDDDV